MNRCLAEGRERFRRLLIRSEDGTRCAELSPLLSAYCDGEASADDAAAVREHLRACAGCRARIRAYRATPAAVAALTPVAPVSRSLLDRAQELLVGLHSRLPGAREAGDAGVAQVAVAGGARGAGMAALAKALAICAGTVGGAAACVATGVAPAPFGIEPQHATRAEIERVSESAIEQAAPPAIDYQPAPPPPTQDPPPAAEQQQPDPAPPEPEQEAVEAGAVEYVAPPPEPAAAAAEPSSSSSDSAAGEFGP